MLLLQAHLGYPRRARRCKTYNTEANKRKRSFTSASHTCPRPLLICQDTETNTAENTKGDTNDTQDTIITDTVTFVVQGKQLCVSRTLLMDASEYYAHMLGGHFNEAQKVCKCCILISVCGNVYLAEFGLAQFLIHDRRSFKWTISTMMSSTRY